MSIETYFDQEATMSCGGGFQGDATDRIARDKAKLTFLGGSFDEVLDESATQSETTAVCCAPAVDAVLTGRNGLIMAYGPTGTGKVSTHGPC